LETASGEDSFNEFSYEGAVGGREDGDRRGGFILFLVVRGKIAYLHRLMAVNYQWGD